MSGSRRIRSDLDCERVEVPLLVFVISRIAIFCNLNKGQQVASAELPHIMLPYIR
jgi:hypothetical protein